MEQFGIRECRRPGRGVFLFLISVLLLLSCQTEDLKLAALPVGRRTLYLQNFTNRTFEADVHIELAEAMRARFDQRRGYVLVGSHEKARFILFGEILVYRREGFMYENDLTPLRYDLNMVVHVRMIERETGAQITSFEEDARTQFSVKEGLAEDELTARQRLYGSLTRKIYARLSEAFPSD